VSAPTVASKPVPADAVHVWRGYQAAGVDHKTFVDFLGTVFVPACALLQPKAGLSAYLPALPMAPDAATAQGPRVPDQTALMFWTTQQTYSDAFSTPAVRAYTHLHGDAYGPPSSAQFPTAYTGQVLAEQPYHLMNNPADWMIGSVWHTVGARPARVNASDFLGQIGAWASAYQLAPPAGVDAALLCAGNDYVAFWQHSAAEVGAPAGLAALTVPYLDTAATTTQLPGGLWDKWPGLDLEAAPVLNIQLDRPGA